VASIEYDGRMSSPPARFAASMPLLLLLAFGPGCRRRSEAPPPAAVDAAQGPSAIVELGSPAAPDSGEPNLAPFPDGKLLLSWIEPAGGERHRLRFSSRTAGGAWSEPVTIAEGEQWFVNWADFPAVAALPDGRLYAHWLERSGARKYAYDVRIVSSGDGGRTWSRPVTPHRDGSEAEHGFVSMAPAAGGVDVVWLDGRRIVAAKKSRRGGHDTGGHDDGQGEDPSASTMLMHTTLAADTGLGEERPIDERVCDCCQTSAARTSRGLVVAYRDRSDREVRDIAVVRLVGGAWSAPAVVGADGWQINGCPVNGPAIAAGGDRVAVAWFAAPADKPGVRVAFSADAAARFGGPIAVDDGRPVGRVDVALDPRGGAWVSWMEQTAGGAELRVRRVTDDGRRLAALTVADSSAARTSGFPRMELLGNELVFAWRDPGEPARVRTAVLEVR
jgi:hypothetical protein